MRSRPLVWPAAVLCTAGFVLPALRDFGLLPDHLVPWPLWLFPVLFVVACLTAPLFPCLPWYAPVLCRRREASGCVALTFDDGPCPETTPVLLRLLRGHDAKATFFLVGRKARSHPDLVRAIVDAGHEVANHTMSHDVLLALRTTGKVREEVVGCANVLSEFGPVPPYLRPPVGIINPRIARVAREEGLTLVNWSVKAGDQGNRKTRGMGRRLARRIRDGDIVLLHDRPPRDQPVDAWLTELAGLLAPRPLQDLRFTTVTQMMQVRRR